MTALKYYPKIEEGGIIMKKIISIFLTAVIMLGCIGIIPSSAVSLSMGRDALVAQWSTGSGHGIDYKAFSPAVSEGIRYPLIVLLHGKYSGSSNGEQVKDTDFYKWSSDEFQSRFNGTGGAYILMPRCPGGDSSSWSVEGHHSDLKALIDDFISSHSDSIDTQRVYLGGWSKGGAGTVKMAVSYPDFFAALIVIAPHYTVNESHLKALSDTPIWLVACKDDITATYGTMSKAFWNTLKDTTNVPSSCRFTTFEKYNYYDTSSHYVHYAVANDLLNQPGDCGMYTQDANGNGIATNESSSIITWLSSFRLNEAEREDVCHCECHSSKGFTQFIWSIKCFFMRIFSPGKRVCSCGKNHW